MIYNSIINLSEEKGEAHYEDLKVICDSLGCDEAFLKKSISQLKHKGLIYECRR